MSLLLSLNHLLPTGKEKAVLNPFTGNCQQFFQNFKNSQERGEGGWTSGQIFKKEGLDKI